MQPLSLTIEGLYSYQQRQTIDFEKLCDAHIFGIFGGVGSGKSSILEAIVFSLYGRTDRLNLSGDNRNYNMLNLKSNKLFVEFIFSSGQEATLYKTVVTGKRNSKRFDDVPKFDHKCFVQNSNQWHEIELKEIEKAIGLNYDNFKRTVIIPQGQFQEFLQLGETARTEMMKELFNLEKYDLFGKAKNLDSKNSENLTYIKGQLEQIGEVSKELITEKKAASAAIQINIEDITNQIKQLNSKRESLQTIKDKHQKLADLNNKLWALTNQKDDIKSREKNLSQYIDCSNTFKELINKVDEKELLKESLLQQHIGGLTKLEVLNKDLEKVIADIAKIEPEYNNREKITERISALTAIAEILEKEKDKEVQKDRIKKGEAIIEQTRKKTTEVTAEIEALNLQITELHKIDTDIERLSKIKEWFLKQITLTDRQKELNTNISEINLKTQKQNDEANKLFESINIKKNGESLSQISSIIDNKTDLQQQELTKTENALQQKLVEEHLGEVSRNLTDGTPCPLCGSEHHPHKWTAENYQHEITELNKTKKQISNYIETLRQAKSTITHINERVIEYTTEKERLTNQLSEINKATENHHKEFIWGNSADYSIEKIVAEIEKGQKTLNLIRSFENQRQQKDAALKTETANLEKYIKASEQIQNQINSLATEISVLQSRIPNFELYNINELNSQSIETEKATLTDNIKKLEQQYQFLIEKRNNIDKDIANISGQIQIIKENLQLTENELKETLNALAKNIENSNYTTLEQVKAILNQPIDIKKEQQAIEAFNKELFALEKEKAPLQEELKESVFNNNELTDIIDQITQQTQKLSEHQKQLGEITSELKQLTTRFDKQKELSKEFNKLQNRAEDIKTLMQLFKGKGFVNYISGTFLQNIVMVANNRFYKLTNQKLRLELSEDNKFMVRDYLNGGQLRNIKTLSGGQTFQAALSLALALSDNIQKHCGTGQSFFFLDEGFGSLDKQSLGIVFDALKSLRKENRIVGVISHVEDMQQEIGAHLSIENHSETGSIIKTNW